MAALAAPLLARGHPSPLAPVLAAALPSPALRDECNRVEGNAVPAFRMRSAPNFEAAWTG